MTSQRPDGSRVHQLLANYQTVADCPCDDIRGGNGYLRVMEFAASGRQAVVRTYSPYLDRFKDDPDNQFLLELDP